MGQAAERAVLARKAGETALSILDSICTLYRGCDAEFESVDPNNPDQVHPAFNDYTDPHPLAALGMLMIEAFAPNGVVDQPRYEPMMDANHPDEEVAYDAWDAEVYKPFNERYRFC